MVNFDIPTWLTLKKLCRRLQVYGSVTLENYCSYKRFNNLLFPCIGFKSYHNLFYKQYVVVERGGAYEWLDCKNPY